MYKLRKLLFYCLMSLLLVAVSYRVFAQAQEDEAPLDEILDTPRTPASVDSTLIFNKPVILVEGRDADVETPEPFPESSIEIETDAQIEERMNTIRRYQEKLGELELDGGPWNQALAEELAALGSLYQQHQSHSEAIDAYSRAVQINRIHHGLETLEQVGLIENLIDSYLAGGNWAEADKYQNYLFYVQNKAFGADDPRMVSVLNKLARWNLVVFDAGYGEALGIRLLNSYRLFAAATQIVNVHFGRIDERYVAYLKNMAGSAYLVSRNQELIAAAGRPEYRDFQSMYNDQVRRIQPINAGGYREGELALLRIVDYYAEDPGNAWEQAKALAELGDWYLLFDRGRTGGEQYRQAYQIASDLENSEEKIAELFGSIVPLPTFTAGVDSQSYVGVTSTEDSKEWLTGYVDVSLDVNVYGAVSNVDVLSEEDESNARVHTLLRRLARNSLFRPLLVEGEPVESKGNRLRYQYRY